MAIFTFIGTAVLVARGLDAMEQAVAESLEDLLAKTMAATPVDTGTLRASQHVDGPHRSGTTVEGKVQTGGEANDYALYVHEGTYRMGGRKFIEAPLIAHIPVHVRHVQDAVRKAY